MSTSTQTQASPSEPRLVGFIDLSRMNNSAHFDYVKNALAHLRDCAVAGNP